MGGRGRTTGGQHLAAAFKPRGRQGGAQKGRRVQLALRVLECWDAQHLASAGAGVARTFLKGIVLLLIFATEPGLNLLISSHNTTPFLRPSADSTTQRHTVTPGRSEHGSEKLPKWLAGHASAVTPAPSHTRETTLQRCAHDGLHPFVGLLQHRLVNFHSAHSVAGLRKAAAVEKYAGEAEYGNQGVNATVDSAAPCGANDVPRGGCGRSRLNNASGIGSGSR